MRERNIEELRRIGKEFESKLPSDTVLKVEFCDYYYDYHIHYGDITIAGELDEKELQNDITLKNVLGIDALLKENFDGWKVVVPYDNTFLVLVSTGVFDKLSDSCFKCGFEKNGYKSPTMWFEYKGLKRRDRKKWEESNYVEVVKNARKMWRYLNKEYEQYLKRQEQ